MITGYPYQYYVSYDHTKPQPTRITGWYNLNTLDSSYPLPPKEDLIGLTQEQWDSYDSTQRSFGLGILGGKIISYSPKIEVDTQTLAQNRLNVIRQQASWLFMRGTPFGPNTNKVIDVLTSIANGTVETDSVPDIPKDLTT